jgi:hypothetical protein
LAQQISKIKGTQALITVRLPTSKLRTKTVNEDKLGPAVDFFAPGERITSCGIKKDGKDVGNIYGINIPLHSLVITPVYRR